MTPSTIKKPATLKEATAENHMVLCVLVHNVSKLLSGVLKTCGSQNHKKSE
jgi:hypothetical protein